MTTTTTRINLPRIIPGPRGSAAGWYKHVTAVDATLTNGWALVGEILNPGLHDVPVGAIMVRWYPTGSVKHTYHRADILRAEADGSLTTVGEEMDWNEAFLAIRDRVAELIDAPKPNPLATYTDDELLAECRSRGLAL